LHYKIQFCFSFLFPFSAPFHAIRLYLHRKGFSDVCQGGNSRTPAAAKIHLKSPSAMGLSHFGITFLRSAQTWAEWLQCRPGRTAAYADSGKIVARRFCFSDNSSCVSRFFLIK